MSLTEAIKPSQEEEKINKIISFKKRPKPEIIVSDALQKSIEIISKFDYKVATDENLIEYKICHFCKNQFPTIQGKIYSCQNCLQTFCVKHRNILNHRCQKLDPNLEKYLAAKSLFKEKMKLLKMKGYH